jgi:predicted nucleotidyltransferase
VRILNEERHAIVEAVRERDPSARVVLFGSRVDDRKRGGDIDILIVSDRITRDSLDDIQERVFERIEEQKLDLVLSGASIDDPFASFILARGDTIDL